MRIVWIVCVVVALLCAGSPARAQSVNFIRDEEIEQLLRVMSRPIFEAAGIPAEQVRFILVNRPELNAFVAGGHNIFIHTGLILEAEDASQLLGVIAHETGHIASGHLLRLTEEQSALSFQMIVAQLLGAALAAGSGSAEAGIAAASLGSHVAVRNMLSHTRAQEGSADTAGVRFLHEAGLPVKGLLGFMRKLESQELLPESQQSEYVRTHPLTQDRIAYLQHMADGDRPSAAVAPMTQVMFDRIQQKLLGYLFPDRALADTSQALSHRYAKALALFRKGRWQESMPIMDALLKEEPDNAYFHEQKGQILYEAGQVEASLPHYKRAVELAPFSGLIRVGYTYSLLASNTNKEQHLKEAIVQLNEAVKKEPRMIEPHHLLAIAYGRQGNKGMSSLHLAEKALKQGNLPFAKQAAGQAEQALGKGTPSYLRVKDIQEYIAQMEKKKVKK